MTHQSSDASAAAPCLLHWAVAAILAICSAGMLKAADETTPHQPSWSHEHLDAVLAPVFVNKMAGYYVAGATIAVVKDGELVYTRGFGFSDVLSQTPVDPNRTIFRIGSVTKTLTGVALLQLVDRRLIDLDADVNDYLTEFKVGDEFPETVLVKHLLTHTAGFDQLGFDRHALDAKSTMTLGDFLSRDLVRIRPPGMSSCYDTYGITLAGHLVEQVSGLTYEEYLRQHVFTPLSMGRTGIAIQPGMQGDHAIGYGFAGEWAPQRWEYMNTDPASTVNSTAVDMANYMLMLLDDGKFNDRQILSSEMTRAMLAQQHTNHPDLIGHSYTLWEDRTYGLQAFSHGGSMNGFGCILYLAPEENLGVFIACNQESGRLEHAVLSALIQHYFSKHENTARPRPAVRGQETDRVIGTYAHNMYNHTRPSFGGWWMRPTEVERSGRAEIIVHGQTARQVAPLTFQRPDGSLVIFRRNDRGVISEMLIDQRVYERLTPEAIDAYETAKQVQPVLVENSVLRRYAGQYRSERGEINIRVRSGGLSIDLPGLGTARCLPHDERTFLLVGAPMRALLRFEDTEGTTAQRAMLAFGEEIIELTRIPPD